MNASLLIKPLKEVILNKKKHLSSFKGLGLE